ncbi:MAG TPA: hypothetical protein VMT89_18420 [Candidatus Acidoferrales bacterium]|nr:hypothetical protein [Candidatus Acidoferrales bacterium]
MVHDPPQAFASQGGSGVGRAVGVARGGSGTQLQLPTESSWHCPVVTESGHAIPGRQFVVLTHLPPQGTAEQGDSGVARRVGVGSGGIGTQSQAPFASITH